MFCFSILLPNRNDHLLTIQNSAIFLKADRARVHCNFGCPDYRKEFLSRMHGLISPSI